MTTTLAASFTPLAIFVLRRLPGHGLGRLMLLTGAIATIAALASCWSTFLPFAWLSQWLWWPPVALVPVMLLLFPQGRPPPTGRRRLLAVMVVSSSVATVALALGTLTAPRTLLTDPDQPVPWLGQYLIRVSIGSVAVLLVATVAVLVILCLRWRRAAELERQQLACLLPCAALLVLGVCLDYLDVPGAWLAAVTSLPLALSVAILRYQFLDLDLYINRGLVWFLLTGVFVIAYAGLTAGLGSVLAPAAPWVGSVVAGGLVAACLLPAERLVQRWVNHLLYGRRDDPYAVLTRAGHHLRAMVDPLAVLPQLAALLVEELRVPYTAIVLAGVDGFDLPIIEHGRPSGPPYRFPMVAHGSEVGELWVAPRRPGSGFSQAEEDLLGSLATQAATAAEACRGMLRLQRAREDLVLAREEERLRLRRDLHDGLASALTGARMLTAAIRQSVVRIDSRATKLLDTLESDLDTCTSEVRDLIDGLRPAALDAGLISALHTLAQRSTHPGLVVRISAPEMSDRLPAAVEVVAYRVVSEAVTNVVKHANARNCWIDLVCQPDVLRMTVLDDGDGLPPVTQTAETACYDHVGLGSMASRVEELGGEMSVAPAPAGGTRVQVALPLRYAAAQTAGPAPPTRRD